MVVVAIMVEIVVAVVEDEGLHTYHLRREEGVVVIEEDIKEGVVGMLLLLLLPLLLQLVEEAAGRVNRLILCHFLLQSTQLYGQSTQLYYMGRIFSTNQIAWGITSVDNINRILFVIRQSLLLWIPPMDTPDKSQGMIFLRAEARVL